MDVYINPERKWRNEGDTERGDRKTKGESEGDAERDRNWEIGRERRRKGGETQAVYHLQERFLLPRHLIRNITY